MPIAVDVDVDVDVAVAVAVAVAVMLARRKMSVGDLADRVGITPPIWPS